jgi:hypothetical protein
MQSTPLLVCFYSNSMVQKLSSLPQVGSSIHNNLDIDKLSNFFN